MQSLYGYPGFLLLFLFVFLTAALSIEVRVHSMVFIFVALFKILIWRTVSVFCFLFFNLFWFFFG